MKSEEYKRRGSLGRRFVSSIYFRLMLETFSMNIIMFYFFVNDAIFRRPNECMRAIVTIIVGIVFGFFIGVSFPVFSPPKIFVSSNPRGAERLPPAIVASQSDFYPRRLFGRPSEITLTKRSKRLISLYLRHPPPSITALMVLLLLQFSENFTILLFHYDGRTTEWDEFEWSKRAIHISIPKQTKWWYAKRFLHPDIVAPYDFIFIWDEDLGVQHFDAEEYIKLVKKHKLEISQPGLDPSSKGLTWQMTKRREDLEVHKETEEKPGWCSDPHLPPCAAATRMKEKRHGKGYAMHLVRDRCKKEWRIFQDRVSNAEKAYYKSVGVGSTDHEANWVTDDRIQ
ncbi:Protein of unknown function DUF707 [Cynara cardunculus var. scolymus]|uniref:Uncharacterized protein n=1 Tax=Cynara cardunculus var. scolymus TaxID=59895 RepID=A0A124SG96_CYNCS|nr:Protein of unknown function DUF707 [Cynara cardunculus var. scolymus]